MKNEQTINLEQNVKFEVIPATYTFGAFTIDVREKSNAGFKGAKTYYIGKISNNDDGTTIEMTLEGKFDIVKIKKAVKCDFKRVYLSNSDGATTPKAKDLTDEMLEGMVESFRATLYRKNFRDVCAIVARYMQVERVALISEMTLEATVCAYRDELRKEQIKIAIERKEREQKQSAKKAVKDAKSIDTTTADGLLKAQLIEAMMSGDFDRVAEINAKLKEM
jgi:hypothetical protein